MAEEESEMRPDGAVLTTSWRVPGAQVATGRAAPSRDARTRQLPNLRKVPTLVLTGEASYHAPYDHCTGTCTRPA